MAPPESKPERPTRHHDISSLEPTVTKARSSTKMGRKKDAAVIAEEYEICNSGSSFRMTIALFPM